MKIDAHVHFWREKSSDKIWIREKISALQRPFTPEDLKPLMAATGIEGVILVQAAPEEAETRYFLEIAEREAFALGVVGWVNLVESDESINATLDEFLAHAMFKGVRNQPPGKGGFDAEWLIDPRVKRGYRKLAERGVPCDLLVTCRQLVETRELLLEIPELTAIINHGGRPSVMTGELEPWASEMRAIATDTAAYCKVSGLVERAGQEWTPESVRPWVEVLLDAFGPQRLVFASNWPVMTIMGSYVGWWETFNSILDTVGVSSAERHALLGGTAAQVYGLADNA